MATRRKGGSKPAARSPRRSDAALRESEERLRLALAGTNQGLYDLNLQTGRAVVTPEYARMLGYEPDETEFSAAWWRERIHPGDREVAERIIGECMRGDRTEYRMEYRLRTKAGDWKWILSLGKVVERDGEGRPLRMLGTHLDVTDARRAEEELEHARRLMEAVMTQSPVPMVVVSAPDMILRYGNRAAIEVLGLSDESDYVGMPIAEVFGRKSWQDFRPDGTPIAPEDLPLSQALRGRVTHNMELVARRKDGTSRWIMVSGAPVYGADGRLLAGLIAFPDITEHKQAEESLRFFQDLEHLITGISTRFVNLGSADIDAAIHEALGSIGRFAGADRSYVMLFRGDGIFADNTHEWCADGIESQRERLQGLRIDDFRWMSGPIRRSEVVSIPRVADVPLRFAFEKAELEREGIRSLLLVPIEFRKAVIGFLGLDAVRRETDWAAGTASLLRIVGEVFAGALDRRGTEAALRSSEERYRVVSDLVNQILYDYSISTGAVEWKGRIEEATGYGVEEFNALGIAGWEALIHPEDRRETVRRLDEAKRAHAPFRAEYRFRRKDGAYMPVEDCGIFFYGEDGTAVRLVGSMKDVTEQKKAQEERVRLHEQLQQAMKMEAVGRLAGGIAHDFNNLLTAIIGNADLARMQGDDSETTVQCLEEIGKAAESAAALTRQLLAFSRRQIIEPRVLDLNDLVAHLEKLLMRLIGEDVTLRTALAPGLGSVKADPGQFEQVLVNLAVNARDAMPDGGRLLIETGNAELDAEYCRLHPYVKPGPYVLVTVSDTGHGMSDEVKKHVFEPFFTTKPTGRGTGLGLATIFGTVKQAGGSVEVYSEVGRGATFKIFLPRVDAVAGRPAAEEAEQRPQAGSGIILLVEDEEGVRNLAQKALERLGYAVLPASNGEEAIRQARGHGGRIDLLMTDVVMPGLNGRELAGKLLAIHPEMKVLYTSGYTEDVAVLHGVVEANLHFIGKPYSLRALAAKIREVLRPDGG